MQEIAKVDVAALPEYHIAIPIFCEENNCTPDVAINALIQRGGEVRALYHNGLFIEVAKADGTTMHIRLTKQWRSPKSDEG